MKMVIYKDFKGLKATKETNFKGQIRDARAVIDCSMFGTPKEIIEYYLKYFDGDYSNFIVDASCNK